MKLFIDSANPEDVRKFADLGIIDGVTTNPSLVSKVGKPYKELVQEIFQIIDGPISLEVLSTDYEGMINEARKLALLHKNVVVKIPLIPAGLKAIKTLHAEKIKTNATLVFSPVQALLAAKAGATYVSPFLGRLDDINEDSLALIKEIRQIFNNFHFPTLILAASIRSCRQIADVALADADVATVPPEILEKLAKHPLTDAGLAKFLEDFKASGLEPLVS